MEFDLRKKLLERLARVNSGEAKNTLKKEMELIENILSNQNSYTQIEQALLLLEAIGYRESSKTLKLCSNFITRLDDIALAYSENEVMFKDYTTNYKTATVLLKKTIEVLITIRYYETKSTFIEFLKLTKHSDDSVCDKAKEGLRKICEYYIEVFYGPEGYTGLGFKPQQIALSCIQSLTDVEVLNHLDPIMIALESFLSPTMEGTSSTYKTLTVTHCAVPGTKELKEIRSSSIEILKKVCFSGISTSKKIKTVYVLDKATRLHHGENAEELKKIVEEDTQRVLEIFKNIIIDGDYELIQKLEHISYWIYHHAFAKELQLAALEVEKVISDNEEYQIYKTLIGFEGIFKPWVEEKEQGADFEGEDDYRKKASVDFAKSINSNNYSIWKKRILEFSKSDSRDLATFPVFYSFLETFALSNPPLALELIEENHHELSRFLIPMLRGLWSSKHRDLIRNKMLEWISEDTYLTQCIKTFLDNDKIDLDLLTLIMNRLAELEDFQSLNSLIAVAVSNYELDPKRIINELLIPTIKIASQKSYANWIFEIWFRKEFRRIVSIMDENGIDTILINLAALKKIDYHAEEVLFRIAERDPARVLHYFCNRLVIRDNELDTIGEKYETIPYRFHKLNQPLSKIPKEIVLELYEVYEKDSSNFVYRGARFVKIIFPDFNTGLENELLSLIDRGDSKKIKFVLAILRNYDGEIFIHNACRKIVSLLPVNSELLNEVAICLENTGVVSGEFGFVKAYERKKEEVLPWVDDPNPEVRGFAESYVQHLGTMIENERARAEEDIAVRKQEYGE